MTDQHYTDIEQMAQLPVAMQQSAEQRRIAALEAERDEAIRLASSAGQRHLAQLTRIAELEAALQPFAAIAETVYQDDDTVIAEVFTFIDGVGLQQFDLTARHFAAVTDALKGAT